jgi:hypothetical protein
MVRRELLVRWHFLEVGAEADEVENLMGAVVALRSCRQARLFETLGCHVMLRRGRSSERQCSWRSESTGGEGFGPTAELVSLGEEKGQESIGLALSPSGGWRGTDARSE